MAESVPFQRPAERIATGLPRIRPLTALARCGRPRSTRLDAGSIIGAAVTHRRIDESTLTSAAAMSTRSPTESSVT